MEGVYLKLTNPPLSVYYYSLRNYLQTEYFCDRTDTAIKNRYNASLKKIYESWTSDASQATERRTLRQARPARVLVDTVSEDDEMEFEGEEITEEATHEQEISKVAIDVAQLNEGSKYSDQSGSDHDRLSFLSHPDLLSAMQHQHHQPLSQPHHQHHEYHQQHSRNVTPRPLSFSSSHQMQSSSIPTPFSFTTQHSSRLPSARVQPLSSSRPLLLTSSSSHSLNPRQELDDFPQAKFPRLALAFSPPPNTYTPIFSSRVDDDISKYSTSIDVEGNNSLQSFPSTSKPISAHNRGEHQFYQHTQSISNQESFAFPTPIHATIPRMTQSLQRNHYQHYHQASSSNAPKSSQQQTDFFGSQGFPAKSRLATAEPHMNPSTNQYRQVSTLTKPNTRDDTVAVAEQSSAGRLPSLSAMFLPSFSPHK
jgi:hypothetical protein